VCGEASRGGGRGCYGGVLKDEGRESGTKSSSVRIYQMKCLIAPPKMAILSTEYVDTETSAPSFEMRMWI